ncbi:MAG: hypothetical protein ACI9E1_002443 [Cryomorphaceae bacterium]|jgi:hypothetical protein
MNGMESVLGCGLCQGLYLWGLIFSMVYVVLIGMTVELFSSKKCEASRCVLLIVVVAHVLAVGVYFSDSIGLMVVYGFLIAAFAALCFVSWVISLFSQKVRSARRFELIYLAVGIGSLAMVNLMVVGEMLGSMG